MKCFNHNVSNIKFRLYLSFFYKVHKLMNDVFVITARKDKNVRRYKSDKERLETEVEELEKKVERMGRSGTQVNKATMKYYQCVKKRKLLIIFFKMLNKARGGLFMINWHACYAKHESFHIAFFCNFKLLLAYWITLLLGKWTCMY